MDYITYDYKTIHTNKDNKYRVIDLVTAFGYEVIETKEISSKVVLSLKRDSSFKCKEELDLKLNEALSLLDSVSNAEYKKKHKALITSIIFGLVGMFTFGGGMSAYMTGDGKWEFSVLGIILGCIGIIMMLVNEPLYRTTYEKSISKYTPIIDENNQKVNAILVEANEMIKKALE